MNELISYEAVYRTAPATPGLLISSKIFLLTKRIRKSLKITQTLQSPQKILAKQIWGHTFFGVTHVASMKLFPPKKISFLLFRNNLLFYVDLFLLPLTRSPLCCQTVLTAGCFPGCPGEARRLQGRVVCRRPRGRSHGTAQPVKDCS